MARPRCFRATAGAEREDVRRLGFRKPIAIIPNGIEIPDLPIDKPWRGEDGVMGGRDMAPRVAVVHQGCFYLVAASLRSLGAGSFFVVSRCRRLYGAIPVRLYAHQYCHRPYGDVSGTCSFLTRRRCERPCQAPSGSSVDLASYTVGDHCDGFRIRDCAGRARVTLYVARGGALSLDLALAVVDDPGGWAVRGRSSAGLEVDGGSAAGGNHPGQDRNRRACDRAEHLEGGTLRLARSRRSGRGILSCLNQLIGVARSYGTSKRRGIKREEGGGAGTAD